MPRLSVPSIGGGRKTMRVLPSRGAGAFSFCAGAKPGVRRSAAARKARLRIITPVEVRENVIAPLTVQEKRFVDLLRAKLIVQSRKTQDVVFRPLAGVG